MPTPMKILMVEDNPGDARLLLEQLKEEGNGTVELSWVDKLEVALEIVERKAYDAVLLDLNLGDSHGLETFARLHEKAPQLPVVLLTGVEDESTALRAVQTGAQDYLVKGRSSAAAITRALHFAVERNRSLQWHRSKSRHAAGGRTIAVLGVKGGVGATTVALNIAASLSQERLVVAAELATGFGHFAARFRNLAGPSAADLFRLEPRAIDAAAVERHLTDSQLGFYLLLGPSVFDRAYTPDAERAGQLVEMLRSMADYTVVDLPAAWTPAHPAVLRKAHAVVLVSERDDLSIAATQAVVAEARRIGVAQDALRLAIVTRAPTLDATSKEKFEQMVGVKLAGIVPMAPDICLAAHRAGAPVTIFRPHSAPAGALAAIAQVASEIATPAPVQAA